MKKTLITVDNLNEYICTQSNKLYSNNNVIITSGAKDLCTKRNIEIVYGCSAPDAQNCCIQSSSVQNNSIQNNSVQSNSAQDNSVQNLIASASKPTATTCCGGISNDPFEQLLVKLAVILKESYGITDMVQLRNLSMEAAKVIKNNI